MLQNPEPTTRFWKTAITHRPIVPVTMNGNSSHNTSKINAPFQEDECKTLQFNDYKNCINSLEIRSGNFIDMITFINVGGVKQTIGETGGSHRGRYSFGNKRCLTGAFGRSGDGLDQVSFYFN